MKKLLLASTALVMTAGVASAGMKVSGWAEIGVIGGDSIETQFWTDVDVNFSGSGETDGGLKFGASVDLDEGGSGAAAHSGTDDGGATYYLAYGNFRLDMGDTDGALDAVMQEVALAAGSITDDETAHAGYNGNATLDGSLDGQIARVSYSMNGFAGHVSVEVDDTGVADPVWGVGVRYSGDMGGMTLGVGLGFQSQNKVADAWGVSVDGKFGNGLSAAINYSEIDFDSVALADQTHWGIGFGYSMNALSIGVNYGEYENKGGVATADVSGVGLAVAYDLGGGLTAKFGYGSSDTGTTTDTWSAGLAMSF